VISCTVMLASSILPSKMLCPGLALSIFVETKRSLNKMILRSFCTLFETRITIPSRINFRVDEISWKF
jgi:hypothetical protein